MSDITNHIFISAAMHYYVAGRYAVFAGLNPTAANLLHHAIEMVLKGALARKGMDLEALKTLGHRLPTIWQSWLGELDELMDRVFTVGSINHKAYVNCLHKSEAKEYLIKENAVAAWKQ